MTPLRPVPFPMASLTPTVGRYARPPVWPTVMLAALAALATLSIFQGVVDVALPAIRGEAPFGFLFQQTRSFGPGFLVGYVFIHNLGLACLVPGYGFLAAWFERHTANRFLIGLVLAGAVVASLAVALEFIFQASARFDLPGAMTLFFAEAAAVLAVAVAAARELKGFVPTRTYEWSLITPLRNLGVPLAYAFVTLLLASAVEAYVLLGA